MRSKNSLNFLKNESGDIIAGLFTEIGVVACLKEKITTT